MATVLDHVQAAATRLGIAPKPTTAVANADPFVAQLLAAMQAAADELLDRYPINRQIVGGAWLRDKDGRPRSTPGADADVVMIDEKLMRLAIVWRWRSDNGFDYAEDFRATEERIARMAMEQTRANHGRAVSL